MRFETPRMQESPTEPEESKEIAFEVFESSDTEPDAEQRESMEKERAERKDLMVALETKGLSHEASLEVIAGFDSEAVNSPELKETLGLITEEYGLPFEEIPESEQTRLLVLYNGIKEGRIDTAKDNIGEVLESAIQERVLDSAFTRLDALQEAMKHPEDMNSLLGNVRDSMHSLDAIARTMEGTESDDVIKESVFTRFNKIAELKSRALHPQLRQAFDSIFSEFGDFIEGDMVPFRIDKGIRDANIEGEPEQGYEVSTPASMEKAMHEMHVRSADEVRELKERNRNDVVETIRKMADEPYVTTEMLQELHQINNRDIVPKEGSRFRTDEVVGFGVRAGLLGKDVGPEMDLLVERANDLIDREALKGTSKLRWEVEAASLHNDMLDIHPFPDRNGSTSLMFLELMMTKKGYEPPAEREKDYYTNLAKILGYNPAAIAVVGYEQAKIAHVPGFFEGESLSKERKRQYVDEINEAADHFVQMKMKRGQGKTVH